MRSCILLKLFPNHYKYLGNQDGSRVPQLLCVLRLRRYGFVVEKFSESNRGLFRRDVKCAKNAERMEGRPLWEKKEKRKRNAEGQVNEKLRRRK